MDYRKLIKSYIENEIETINKIDIVILLSMS